MDDDDSLCPPEQRADPTLQVAQRVAVFGEEDELLVRRRRGLWRYGDTGVVGHRLFREPIGDRSRSEDLAEQGRQLPPLLVLAAAPDRVCKPFESLQRLDLHSQFADRPRGGSLVEDLLFGRLQFGVGRILKVFDVFLVESRDIGHDCGASLVAPL
jgi:hypothetical protein